MTPCPLLLLPGLGDSASEAMWAPLLDCLPPHGAFDVRFGPPVAQTTASRGLRTVAELGAAMADHLRAPSRRAHVVVAHSLGTFLAMDLAARLPDLVGSLVLVNGTLRRVPASDVARARCRERR